MSLAARGNRDLALERAAGGYFSSEKAAAGSIQVRHPDGVPCAFPEMRPHDHLFRDRPDVSRSWEVSFYRSLFDADGVLLIGGGQSTLVAGLIAISAKTPLVAVAAFGGKAREVREALARAQNGATENEVELMGRGWRPGIETELVNALLAQQHRRDERQAADRRKAGIEARHRRASLGVAAAAVIAAIAAILTVEKTKPASTTSLIALFVAPLVAGVADAIIRTVLNDGSYSSARIPRSRCASRMNVVCSPVSCPKPPRGVPKAHYRGMRTE